MKLLIKMMLVLLVLFSTVSIEASELDLNETTCVIETPVAVDVIPVEYQFITNIKMTYFFLAIKESEEEDVRIRSENATNIGKEYENNTFSVLNYFYIYQKNRRKHHDWLGSFV